MAKNLEGFESKDYSAEVEEWYKKIQEQNTPEQLKTLENKKWSVIGYGFDRNWHEEGEGGKILKEAMAEILKQLDAHHGGDLRLVTEEDAGKLENTSAQPESEIDFSSLDRTGKYR